jgi:serine/threonine protein kinase
MWWDDDTIERTVTKEFVCSRLVPKEIERLNQPLGFGDGLTDCTYWDWIDEKAKKIFLVLVDLGLPDQIFGLIDDSLDDDDLPVALDQVERLELTPSKDEKTERKFYHRQFHYLLRPLQKGGHIDYDDDEVVPLDVVDKKHAAGQHIDKVTLPNEPGTVLCRCRIPLGPGHLSWGEFISEIDGIKHLQDEHLLSYWTSYTHQGYGYILFTPAPEYTLKSLLTTTPSCLKNLDKKGRRQLVMDWIHCLVDTVCFLHNRGLTHGNIRPSTVMFSDSNLIFFSGFTRFHTSILSGVTDNTSFDKEAYDHAAPEKLFKPVSSSPTSLPQRPAEPSTTPPNNHASNPTPQAADIFSLGCVILELLSFLFKKHGRPFAAHRAAKHKSAGRGGAVPDSSFHKNLGQVESWMTQLAKEASKKDDAVFKGVAPMLYVVEEMLAFYPAERPSADEVRARMRKVFVEACGISELHCGLVDGGMGIGMGDLTLGSGSVERGGRDDSVSSPTERKGGLGEGEHKRNGSRGSGSSGSIRRTNSSAQEGKMERALWRTRSGSHGSPKTGKHILTTGDKANHQWPGPLYEGKYFVLLNK